MKTILLGLIVAAGCATSPTAGDGRGNETLGVAEFQVTDSPTKTTVIGLDASGAEVARVDLVHGHFALTGAFKDDYATAEVDGRQLHITIEDQGLQWETAGYEPVLSMPAPPPSQWMITALLQDPHVRATLDRWQIGFEGLAAVGEDPYALPVYHMYGYTPQFCQYTPTCGSAYYGTINTCGGSTAPAFDAATIVQTPGTHCGYFSASYNQILMSQCCPPSNGQTTNWFAQKACPTTSDNNTSCGVRTTGACKACPTYPVSAANDCSIGTGLVKGQCSGTVYDVAFTHTQYCVPYCPTSSYCGKPDGCGNTCNSYDQPQRALCGPGI